MLQYSNGTRRSISGAGLSQFRRRLSAVERAVLAAEIVDGRIILQGLTAKTVADLCGVSLSYTNHALLLSPEQRAAVVRGVRPLVTPKPAVTMSKPMVDWARFGELELVEAVKQIGVDRVLDAAVAAE